MYVNVHESLSVLKLTILMPIVVIVYYYAATIEIHHRRMKFWVRFCMDERVLTS